MGVIRTRPSMLCCNGEQRRRCSVIFLYMGVSAFVTDVQITHSVHTSAPPSAQMMNEHQCSWILHLYAASLHDGVRTWCVVTNRDHGQSLSEALWSSCIDLCYRTVSVSTKRWKPRASSKAFRDFTTWWPPPARLPGRWAIIWRAVFKFYITWCHGSFQFPKQLKTNHF